MDTKDAKSSILERDRSISSPLPLASVRPSIRDEPADIHRNGIRISSCEHVIPDRLGPEIDRLYASLYSSMAMFRAAGTTTGVSVFELREGNTLKAIFVFRKSGMRVQVINEMIRVEARWINAFARHVFEHHPEVRSICFRGIQAGAGAIDFPCQRVFFTNDVVLKLSASPGEYLVRMGKSTRENIRRGLKLIRHDFPAFRFEVHNAGDPGNEQRVKRILELSQARLASKGKVSGISAEEERRIYFLAQDCGMIATAVIDGKICAGAIMFKVRNSYFLRTVAHEPAYNRYSLGMLCCYLSIEECMRRGATHYHFLFGRQAYKFRLLGENRNFDAVTIYRSYLDALPDLGTILRVAASVPLHRAKEWLVDPEHRDRPVVRLAQALRHALKR